MATKAKTASATPTNFDKWKQTLTLESIAGGKFIVLSCGACPASGVTCNKYDTTCRGNFLLWAKSKAESDGEEVSEDE
jgi:hypothetical protein